jgi:hypothetical protein
VQTGLSDKPKIVGEANLVVTPKEFHEDVGTILFADYY